MTQNPTKHRRGRRMQTRTSVRVADRVARSLITLGGLGTTVAVCGVFLFLLWVVKDLFLGASVGEPRVAGAAIRSAVAVGVDEYQVLGWCLDDSGALELLRCDDGSRFARQKLFTEGGPALTASARSADGRHLVLGFADGTFRLLTVGFTTEYREADELPEELRHLEPGQVGVLGDALAERTPLGQFRVQRPAVELGEPMALGAGTEPLVAVARADAPEVLTVAGVTASGRVAVRRRTAAASFSGDVVASWDEPSEIAVESASTPPSAVALTDFGNNLHVIWARGRLQRIAIGDPRAPQDAEHVDLTAASPAAITAVGVLLGGSTLIIGHADGALGGWFVRPDSANSVDSSSLALAHRFAPRPGGAVLGIASAARDRLFAAGSVDGHVRVYYMTSGKELADLTATRGTPVAALAFAPKNDAILAGDETGLFRWPFEPRHPEASFRSVFGKVWYERYPEPAFEWQSSGGTDDVEPKLSLVPLVFGTIKATIYSMLLGVPLALLAAIYTSEFLNRRARARIKPTIELMASLPSVVLGFLAAIVVAPVVERNLPVVFGALFAVPISLLVAAHVWQVVPLHRRLRWERYRLVLVAAVLAAGLAGSTVVGPWVEKAMFAGDVRAWLDGRVGSGANGLVLLSMPVSALLTAWLVSSRVNPWLRRATAQWETPAVAWAHFAKFVVGGGVFVGIAVVLGLAAYRVPELFGAAPWDIRGGVEVGGLDLSPLRTYDQRNAVVVGFIMGFAIIPIIYTIAEDALSSVPEHLRAASLGAGATPWQTAVRVIVPTAMSGLFSACMIGLGRAVGETMIVLMAAGNTPVLSMNAFSGFRTLSANIATELPEAVRDSTHYRTLFLAALVLFVMTFVINTVAETVRQRFRRRAYQL